MGDLNPYMAGCQVAYADGTDEPTPEHLEIVRRIYDTLGAREERVMSHLGELSELLGVRVTDVRGIYVWTEGRGRPTAPNAWILTLADGRESPPLHSDRLRDVWGLNRWAHVGGGPRPCPS